jgi:hypothetical protein
MKNLPVCECALFNTVNQQVIRTSEYFDGHHDPIPLKFHDNASGTAFARDGELFDRCRGLGWGYIHTDHIKTVVRQF